MGFLTIFYSGILPVNACDYDLNILGNITLKVMYFDTISLLLDVLTANYTIEGFANRSICP